MSQNKTFPIDLVDFKAENYAPDGKSLIISLATKYSADRRAYSLPVTCLYSFIADLQKLQAPTSGQPSATPAPAPTADAPSAPAEKIPPAPVIAKDPNRISIAVPRKWMLRSGLPDHPYVIMVFDPQTDKQTGFALSAASAKEMAAGLTKYAEELARQEAAGPKAN